MTSEHEPKAAEVTVELEAALVDVGDDVPHDATVEGVHMAAGATGDVENALAADTRVEDIPPWLDVRLGGVGLNEQSGEDEQR
jgi:hypothetical protein